MPMATAPAPPAPSPTVVDIRPQKGPQETFLSCSADVVLYGGAAGGGKTWSILLEPLYHLSVPTFGAVTFRRTYPEIVNTGGMWEESAKLYPYRGGRPNSADHEWTFPTDPTGRQHSTVKFAHLQHDKDALNWKGAQIPLIQFDQVESFSSFQFWYLLSRNRSMCGVRPYVRATCNPVPSDDPTGGWVHQLIAWWLDCDCAYCHGLPASETGFQVGNGRAREDRGGVWRWFARIGGTLVWGESAEALATQFPNDVCPQPVGHDPQCELIHALSFTFIPSKLQDNQALLHADPTYLSKLKALPLVEQERLLGGNWKIRPEAGKVFNRSWFTLVEALPVGLKSVRYWDKAGTREDENPAAAYTAGVRIGRDERSGLFYVEDVVRGRWSAGEREQTIHQTAQLDGPSVTQVVEQEPGSGGKESAYNTVLNLAGYTVVADKVTGDKGQRANPYAAQCYAGNVRVKLAPWTQAYLDELHNFDPEKDGYKDQVDASSGAFNYLTLRGGSLQIRSGGVTLGLPTKTAPPNMLVADIVAKQGFYWPGSGGRR